MTVVMSGEEKPGRAAAELTREELLREYHMFKNLMENIPLSIYFKDKEGRLIKISKYKEMTNLGKETIGKTDFDLYPAEAAEMYWEDDKRVMETKQPIIRKEEGPIILSDGLEHYFLTTKAPVLDDEGNVMGVLGITSEITELKKVQRALEEERILLRTLVDLLPGPVYVKDAACRKILANRADLRNMGVETEAEAIGKTDFDFYPKEVAEKFYADDQSVLQTGEPVLGREEVNIVEGQPRYYLTSKVPMRDSTGKTIGLVGIGIDITDYKEAEKQRLEAEKEAASKRAAAEAVAKIAAATSEAAQKYKATVGELRQMQEKLAEETALFTNLMDNLPHSVYFKDREGRLIRINKRFLELIPGKPSRRTPEEVIGKTDFDLFPEPLAKAAAEDEKRIMETGKPIIDKEERFITPDGSEMYLSTTKAPIFDREGNIIGIVGITRDITEQKKSGK
jgi:PAS domain S-box-containing protein